MRNLTFFVALLPALAGASVHAEESAGWALGNCDPRDTTKSREAGEERIRGAAPETSLWVPNPFSGIGSEIVENVLARHYSAFSDLAESQLSPEDARLFRLQRNGGLRTELVRVADWTPTRCDRAERRDAYWLVRFFDSAAKQEITRILARDSGLISRVRHATPAYSFPPLPPHRVPERFAADLATARRSSAQYVTTWGPDPCDAMTPCVAWRVAGGIGLIKGGKLLLVSSQSEHLSFTGDLSNLRAGPAAERLQVEGKELLSLGGDLFAAADVLTKPALPEDLQ